MVDAWRLRLQNHEKAPIMRLPLKLLKNFAFAKSAKMDIGQVGEREGHVQTFVDFR